MEDKRAFSRIPVRLQAYLRTVADAEAPPALREALPAGEAPDRERLRGANLHEAVVETLVDVSRKLDAVLSLLSQDRLALEYPMTAEVVELSGAGCQLVADTAFPLDQAVELVIILSQFPLRLAAAVGRVVRREEAAGRPVWAVDFTAIHEADLEAVVQYVFREQRAAIRAQKWS